VVQQRVLSGPGRPHLKVRQTLRRSFALRREKEHLLSLAVRTQTRSSSRLVAHAVVELTEIQKRPSEQAAAEAKAKVAAKKMRVPVKKILDIVGSVLRLVVPLVRKKKGKEK
jgi:hypothetical protein